MISMFFHKISETFSSLAWVELIEEVTETELAYCILDGTLLPL